MSTTPADPIEDDAAREAAARRRYVRPNPRIAEAALPPLAYVVVNSLAGVELAIAASFAASAIVFVRNRGHGTIRALGVFGFAITAGSAGVGLLLGSGKAFVAQNIFIDFLFAAIFAGSVVVGRPFIGLIVREIVPALQPVMEVRHPLFVRLTLISAALNIFTGVIRIFLLMSLSSTAYVIVSRALGLPLSVAFYFLCYVLVQRTAIRIWPADMPPPNRDGTPGTPATTAQD